MAATKRIRKCLAETLKGKYFGERQGLQASAYECGASQVWNGIVRGLDLLKEGSRWEVRNGKDVCFWKDNWLINEPLSDKVLRDISNQDMEKKVEFWNKDVG